MTVCYLQIQRLQAFEYQLQGSSGRREASLFYCLWASKKQLMGHCGKQNAELDGPVVRSCKAVHMFLMVM